MKVTRFVLLSTLAVMFFASFAYGWLGTGPSGGGGAGTVTSVGTSAPITGGPITTTGTVACATCATTTNGGALSGTAPITVSAAGVIAGGGLGTTTGALKGNGSGVITQAACADLSNAAASCSTDATNAANISSGLLPMARLPNGLATIPGTGSLNPYGCTNVSTQVATTNNTNIECQYIPYPTTAVHFIAQVVAADNTNFSDVGLYGPCTPGSSCNLLFDAGQFKSAATGVRVLSPIVNASCTAAGVPSACCTGSGAGTCAATPISVPAGLYCEAWTSASNTFSIQDCNPGQAYNFYGFYASQGATTNGILNATITMPSAVSSFTLHGPQFTWSP